MKGRKLMNIKNFYLPDYSQSKKIDVKTNSENEISLNDKVDYIDKNIKQQKKDMKFIVNTSAFFSIIGGIIGKYLSVKHLYNPGEHYVQDFKFISAGFLTGGILAAGASLLKTINRDDKKSTRT